MPRQKKVLHSSTPLSLRDQVIHLAKTGVMEAFQYPVTGRKQIYVQVEGKVGFWAAYRDDCCYTKKELGSGQNAGLDIQHLVVAPEFRKQGIASALVFQVMDSIMDAEKPLCGVYMTKDMIDSNPDGTFFPFMSKMIEKAQGGGWKPFKAESLVMGFCRI